MAIDPFAGIPRLPVGDDNESLFAPSPGYAAYRASQPQALPDVNAAIAENLATDPSRPLQDAPLAGLEYGARRFLAAQPTMVGGYMNLAVPGSGDALLDTAAGMQRRAEAYRPTVSEPGDVHDVGDALAYARNIGLEFVPDMAAMLATRGAGGAVGRALGRRATTAAVKDFGEAAERKAALELAPEAVKSAAARESADAVDLVKRTVDAQAKKVAVGQTVGTIAGMYPSTVGGEGAERLKEMDRTELGKTLLGDVGVAAVGALPEIRLFGRIFGDKAAQEVAAHTEKFLPRVLKETATQGAVGAGAGAAQAAAQLGVHKWIGENIDLLSPESLEQYKNAAIAGGTLGVALGGGVEAVRALPIKGIAGKIATKVGEAAQKSREVFAAAKSKAGEYVDTARTMYDEHLETVRAAQGGVPLTTAGEHPGTFREDQTPGSVREAEVASESIDTKPGTQPLTHMDALDTLVATPEGTSEHGDALTAAKRQLKVDFYDGTNGSLTGQNNVIAEQPNSVKGRKLFAAKENDPSTVELAGGFKYGNKQLPRRALFEIGNLVSNELQRTPGMSLRDAYDTALSNLRLLGHEIKPESVKAGTIWQDANKAENKLVLSEKDAQKIRDGLTYRKGVKGAEGPQTQQAAEHAAYVARAGAERAAKIEALGAAVAAKHQARTAGETHASKLLKGDGQLSNLLAAQEKYKSLRGEESPRIAAKIAKRAHEVLSANTKAVGHQANIEALRGKVQELAPHLFERQGEARPTEFHEPTEEQQGIEDTRQDSPDLREREPPPVAKTTASDPYRGHFVSKDGTPTKASAAIAKVRQLLAELTAARGYTRDPVVDSLRKRAENTLPKQEGEVKIERGTVPRSDVPIHKIIVETKKAIYALEKIAHKVGGKIGTAELEGKIKAHPGAAKEFEQRLAELPTKTHEWFKRAAEGEFASLRVGETAPDFNKVKALSDTVDEAQTRFDKAEEVLRQKPDNAFAKAEHATARRDLDEAEAARTDAHGKANDDVVEAKKVLAVARAAFKRDRTNSDVRKAYRRAKHNLREAQETQEAYRTQENIVSAPVAGAEGSSGGVERTATAQPTPKRKVQRKSAAPKKTEKASTPEVTIAAKPVTTTFEHARGVENKGPKFQQGEVPSESVGKPTTVAGAVAKSTKKDHAKLTKIANKLLDALGIKDHIFVTGHEEGASPHHYGSYNVGLRRIRLNDSIKGAARIEVLAHELGHHILRAELAKAMGVSIKEFRHWVDKNGRFDETRFFEAMEEHSPELYKSLREDYGKWLMSHNTLSPKTKVKDMLAGRETVNASKLPSYGKNASLSQLNLGKLNYLLSFDEYIADHISRALTHSDSSPVGKFFSGLVNQLKKAYKLLFTGKGGEKYAAAPSVEKWINGLFDKQKKIADAALGESVPKAVAETMEQAAAVSEHVGANPQAAPAGTGAPASGGGGAAPPFHPAGAFSLIPPSPDHIQNIFDYMKYTISPENRAIIDRKTRLPAVMKRLAELFPQYRKQLMSAEEGLETRLALAYLAHKDGLLNYGKSTRSLMAGMADDLHAFIKIAKNTDYAMRVFDDMAADRVETKRLMDQRPLRNAKAFEDARHGERQKTYNAVHDAVTKMTKPFEGLFESSIGRMQATSNPAIQRIAAMLHLHTGQTGDKQGLITETFHNQDKWSRKLSDIINASDTAHIVEAMSHMQAMNTGTHATPEVQAVVDKFRKFFDEALAYSHAKGLKFDPIEHFFPVIADLKTEADIGAMRDLLSNPKFRADIKKYTWDRMPKKDADGFNTKMKARIEYMVDRAKYTSPSREGIDPEDQLTPGAFRSEFKRAMQFIYEKGDAADKAAFASLQTKDPNVLISRYVVPMVRRAESAHRFGQRDEKLDRYLIDAKRQGATEEQLQQVRNAVDGARGLVGIDGSPVLKKFFGEARAKQWSTAGNRKVIQGMQAYQNIRVLPLVTVSSLVDPLNIAVRTGDFGLAWKGFKAGIKTLYSKAAREEMLKHLQTLGSADDFFTNGILGDRFGTGSAGVRKFNEKVFKAYGLYQWTRATRFMALHAAHGFLLKHQAMATPIAERYLSHELNLKPGDVVPAGENRVTVLDEAQRAAATPDVVARDDRVRAALLRVVDESIIRPNAQMSPNWHADPYMGLVTQYKSFAYAMHDQIGKRVLHERQQGNLGIYLPAMSYIPAIIAAEMVRGFIQYGPSGNPNRDKWGPGDWVGYALTRAAFKPSGVFATEALADRKHHVMAGTSLLGPTYQQGRELLGAAQGSVPLGTAALHAAPGQALYRNWGPSGEPSGGMQRRDLP